jgi:hypothetical protein
MLLIAGRFSSAAGERISSTEEFRRLAKSNLFNSAGTAFLQVSF